ncbi:MAG: CcoQ/FixQ family Cbb3-type cytochrome c oxidase assembly chaperone [Bacteroidia bacterium]|nr:CcoQ/FixQ family Cbb3-type cytochrome c oxidase assembly chaperone [Bacteroidia bacterium]
MKFINYLESITGVGIYPLTSFIIFFVFFLAVTLFVIKADKNFIKEVSQIPLD